MGRAKLPVVSLLLALGPSGCRSRDHAPPIVDPEANAQTVAWYQRHHDDLVHVVGMLQEDRDKLTSLTMGFGNLASASGPSRRCGSIMHGGRLPWQCDDQQVRQTYGDVEAYLGLAPGRLVAYYQLLDTVEVTQTVGPTGRRVRFHLAKSNPNLTRADNATDIVYLDPPSSAADVDAGAPLHALGAGFFAAGRRD